MNGTDYSNFIVFCVLADRDVHESDKHLEINLNIDLDRWPIYQLHRNYNLKGKYKFKKRFV
jgi:hypothetical protein